ncbi:MAG: hypothetical protein LAO56_23605 [Acidobacteriia bacterium]|nr:hypothetical protein [Terriglobia bacterium]
MVRSLPSLLRENGLGSMNGAAVHPPCDLGGGHGYKRDFPHSKQRSFNRDVINPQDGHILCDPNPAICGFSLLRVL